MVITKFQILLSTTVLKTSSFNFRSNEGGNTGTCVTQGMDQLDFITNNIGETITLNMVQGGTTIELVTCLIDYVNESEGATNKSLSITLKDLVFSGSVPAIFDIDDFVITRQLQKGLHNFTLPYFVQGWQWGMIIRYIDIERYIKTVGISKSETGGPIISFVEGLAPADDEEIEEDPGLPGCTTGFSVGTVLTSNFNTYCSSGYSDPDTTHISAEGYSYDMYVFTCKQFTLSVEASITVEFQSVAPGLDTTDIASGFEFDLIEGEYTLFTDPTPTVYTYRGSGQVSLTLPAGIYTCRLTLYIDRSKDSAGWITSEYTLGAAST